MKCNQCDGHGVHLRAIDSISPKPECSKCNGSGEMEGLISEMNDPLMFYSREAKWIVHLRHEEIGVMSIYAGGWHFTPNAASRALSLPNILQLASQMAALNEIELCQ